MSNVHSHEAALSRYCTLTRLHSHKGQYHGLTGKYKGITRCAVKYIFFLAFLQLLHRINFKSVKIGNVFFKSIIRMGAFKQ